MCLEQKLEDYCTFFKKGKEQAKRLVTDTPIKDKPGLVRVVEKSRDPEYPPARIKYSEWHSPKTGALWQRLEIPGFGSNGGYRDERLFNAKEFWNAHATELINQHQELEHFDNQFGAAFAVEHYLRRTRLG